MRRIAVINQKGGVGKTTTAANLGAALAEQGRRVVLVDMDAQANLSVALDFEVPPEEPSTYTVLHGSSTFAEALRSTATEGLSIVPANIDLSGAELELAGALGREHLLRDSVEQWEQEARERDGGPPAHYVLFDCPPSLGLLSINALSASREVIITLQTEFLALQGMSKLVEVIEILKRRINPGLEVTGILPCLYDSRTKLAREVLAEIRTYFPETVFPHPVRTNVKLAEAPSFAQTIFEYAPDSNGAHDYRLVAQSVIAQEDESDPDLVGLPAALDIETLKRAAVRPRASADADRDAATPVEEIRAEVGAQIEPEPLAAGPTETEILTETLTETPTETEAGDSGQVGVVETENEQDSPREATVEELAIVTLTPAPGKVQARPREELPRETDPALALATPPPPTPPPTETETETEPTPTGDDEQDLPPAPDRRDRN